MPSYLLHFNRLHDKKGRFTYGDGDGDGRRNDRGDEKKTVIRTPNTGYHREGLRGAEKVTSGYLTKPVNTSNSLSGNKRTSASVPKGIFKAAGRNPRPEPRKPSWEDNGNGTSTSSGGGGGSIQTAIENGKRYIENILVMDDIADDLEEKIKKNNVKNAIRGGKNNKDTRGYGKVDTSTKHTTDYTHRKDTRKSYGENRHVSGK